MNDRIYQALTAAGLSTSPLSVLDHASTYASAFFALYDTELLYHEAGKNSQVPLRDVTRIHSDREGVLRVETSERTAVTASLVGYDPGRVQAFFQQVRDVTARAKELPVLPLNQAKTEVATDAALPGSSVSAAGMPGLSAYTPATAPAFSPPPAPAPQTPITQSPATQPPAPPVVSPAEANPASVAPTAAPAPTPTPVAPPTAPVPPMAPATAVVGAASRRDGPRPEPVVISSMPPVSDPPPFQERAGERNRQASRVGVRVAEPEVEPVAASAAPVVISPTGGHTQGPLVSAPSSGPGDRPGDAGGDLGADPDLQSDLLRRAEGVRGLARTVGLLAVVLGLAAIALAYFQWQGPGTSGTGSSGSGTSGSGTLSAIWTLLAGGVGTVALLAFAEALRLLSALARSAARRA